MNVLLAVLLAACLLTSQGAHGATHARRFIPIPQDLKSRLKSTLFDAAASADRHDVDRDALRRRLEASGIDINADGAVLVEIIAPVGAPPIDAARLTPFGGRVTTFWHRIAECRVPLDRLIPLARSLPPGYFIDAVEPLNYDDVPGEGPDVTNSAPYRDNDLAGQGVIIAVIDGGYHMLSEARANGDAPPAGAFTEINLAEDDFEDSGDGTHGTGVVESVFDYAPGAAYRLYKIRGLTDLGVAVDDAIANRANIISHSLSWYNHGWSDDSGPVCEAVNAAARAEILFFTSAGNRAEQHWQGPFNPGTGDPDLHDWLPGEETLPIVFDPNEGANFYLSWDTSGGLYDYDLYLFDAVSGEPLERSINPGNQFESFFYRNTTGVTIVANLEVLRVAGGVTEIEVFAHGGGSWQGHRIPQGSTTSPSNCTHPNVVSCGAVLHANYDSPPGQDPIEHYSSRGPSNSGMHLPDLVGPTGTTGFTFPLGFSGTSAATPNTAGVAAVIWSCDTDARASAIRARLFDWANTFKDWGSIHRDDTYGHGGVFLPYLNDCNHNESFDACDILSGDEDDCDGNGHPDACPGCESNCECPDGLVCNFNPNFCVPCGDDDECDDGLPCNGLETCFDGACLPGTPVDCEDGFECTIDTCNQATGLCETVRSDPLCMNDSYCDGIETCVPQVGCVSSGPPCAADQICDEVNDNCDGCANVSDCRDGLPCTFERCVGTTCIVEHRLYGDLADNNGVCGPDGTINIFDILAVIDAFQENYDGDCTIEDIDLAGVGSCLPDGTINIFDIFAVIDAFLGNSACCN